MSNADFAICQKCGKEYIVTDKNADENFCSFECWEKVNCQTPQKRVESFDMGDLFVTAPQKA